MLSISQSGTIPISNDNAWRPIRTGEVACPHCGAPAGQICRGDDVPFASYHMARIDAFRGQRHGYRP